jgi:hypothetical protein
MDNLLKEVVDIIEENYHKNKTTGKLLFKAFIKSLFGL